LIVTLTMNPAIDRTITVDRLAFEDRAYIRSSHDSPGGRGINASCVIHAFGGKTLAIAPSGGAGGKRFSGFLQGCGFEVELVQIRHDIRTNLTITDRHGVTVNLNEAGPKLSAEEYGAVESLVRKRLSSARWLLLCGSLPPGVPADFYGRLIEAARASGTSSLLDTDGPALREGLEAGPSVVAPNQHEAERLLNRALLTRSHFLDAAAGIQSMGAGAAIVSLGSRGAVGAQDGGALIEALPPRIDAVCPIGAGDALAAAFTWSMTKTEDFAESLRWGVAAGTASAKLPGVGFASLEETKEIYRQVELRRVE
jgi:1-phosphofructokinase family hexose kinase